MSCIVNKSAIDLYTHVWCSGRGKKIHVWSNIQSFHTCRTKKKNPTLMSLNTQPKSKTLMTFRQNSVCVCVFGLWCDCENSFSFMHHVLFSGNQWHWKASSHNTHCFKMASRVTDTLGFVTQESTSFTKSPVSCDPDTWLMAFQQLRRFNSKVWWSWCRIDIDSISSHSYRIWQNCASNWAANKKEI